MKFQVAYQHRTYNESAIKQHVKINEVHFLDFKQKFIELQHIIKENPLLNRQLKSQSVYEIKKQIISKT